MSKKMTITDNKGRKTEITCKGTYTVVYKDEDGKPQLDRGAYLNYYHDGYIGHDDCEGNGHGRRFLIDGAKIDYLGIVDRKNIIAVIPTEEFMEKVLKLFAE